MKTTPENQHLTNDDAPVVCVYHDPCQDGIASAWVVNHALSGKEIEFAPDNYGQNRSDKALTPENLAGKHLLIVDFSFSKERMIELAKIAKTVTILDHHEKSETDMANLINSKVIKGVFDTKQAGCLVTWDFFFDEPAPTLLKHFSDRDLYTFNMEGSKEIFHACRVLDYTIGNWNELIANTSIESLIETGRPLLQKAEKAIADNAKLKSIVSIAGFEVPLVECAEGNSTSELCAFLYDESDVPFAVAYVKTECGIELSFRSKKGQGENVNLIAQRFNGGGHPCAAGGFVKNLDELID